MATREFVPGNPHYYVDRQAIYLIVGGLLMAGALAHRLFPPASSHVPLYGALMLSILSVLVLGHKTALGAQRAIEFPLFSFQASELGKVLLILALSAFVVSRSRRLRDLETTVQVMLAALVPALFVSSSPTSARVWCTWQSPSCCCSWQAPRGGR